MIHQAKSNRPLLDEQTFSERLASAISAFWHTFETCDRPRKGLLCAGSRTSPKLTYIRKDGSRFPAVVSITTLRDV
jgi:hypothetical protein